MSLRNKLILLFMGLAIVPLLVLAAFSYWHAQNLLRSTVQAQLQERAEALSHGLEGSRAEIEEELVYLAADLSAQQGLGAQSPVSPAPIHPSLLLARAAFVEFRDASGGIRMLEGSMPATPIQCSPAGASRILEVSIETEMEGVSGFLSAGFWASALFDPESGPGPRSAYIIDASTHEVLFSGDCQILQGGGESGLIKGLALLPPDERPSGSFKYREGGESSLGAFASIPGTGWSVVTTARPIAVSSSLNRMVVAYWLFVLGLAFTTAVSFSMLIGKFTRSLQELARAAEEIGTGELDPWLPLPTSGEVGQLTLAFSRMLSRIRQMMAKIDQSGRLAVVGQLSAYLAHEIRNPLSSIKLNLQRLERWTKNGSLPEFCLEPVEISLKEVERLTAAVSGVLELSSAADSPLVVVSLHDLVGEAADLLAPKFRRQGVILTLHLDAEADRVLARVGQVKSVILNLMVNALEAQPQGGRLEVSSRLSREPERGGPVVALHFKDGGLGVPPEIRDRIFEPFFTTKSGGSGIGLAMASQAIHDCLGELYLEPSWFTESGADFVVVLPLAAVEGPKIFEVDQGQAGWTGIPQNWRGNTGHRERKTRESAGPPSHLMSPEGLKVALTLSPEDPEETK